jgi:hypothetical protein
MAIPKSRIPIHSRPRRLYEYHSSPAVCRLKVNGNVAEILRDDTLNPPIFHCVVQPAGSAEILFWAQSCTAEEAEDLASGFLREMQEAHRRDPDR